MIYNYNDTLVKQKGKAIFIPTSGIDMSTIPLDVILDISLSVTFVSDVFLTAYEHTSDTLYIALEYVRDGIQTPLLSQRIRKVDSLSTYSLDVVDGLLEQGCVRLAKTATTYELTYLKNVLVSPLCVTRIVNDLKGSSVFVGGSEITSGDLNTLDPLYFNLTFNQGHIDISPLLTDTSEEGILSSGVIRTVNKVDSDGFFMVSGRLVPRTANCVELVTGNELLDTSFDIDTDKFTDALRSSTPAPLDIGYTPNSVYDVDILRHTVYNEDYDPRTWDQLSNIHGDI